MILVQKQFSNPNANQGAWELPLEFSSPLSPSFDTLESSINRLILNLGIGCCGPWSGERSLSNKWIYKLSRQKIQEWRQARLKRFTRLNGRFHGSSEWRRKSPSSIKTTRVHVSPSKCMLRNVDIACPSAPIIFPADEGVCFAWDWTLDRSVAFCFPLLDLVVSYVILLFLFFSFDPSPYFDYRPTNVWHYPFMNPMIVAVIVVVCTPSWYPKL